MLAPVAGGENVVAEIRGREKPDEFVLLTSHLDSWDLGKGALDAGCNAALVIEAARIIHLTGLRPRRSIRFVLFSGHEQGKLGSWGYVQAHRAELDRIAAAISFDRGTGHVIGFSLGGRTDLEAGVRESITSLDSSWGVTRYSSDATLDSDNLDFLLEGVPNILASQENAGYVGNRHSTADIYDKIDIGALKRNTAVAGVLAFGLAEREMPLGPRLSRADTEALLERTGVAASMRQADLWTLWQEQARGRLP
jgi:Zn-dependent M28 family amino/carboxypeptidase